MVGANIDGSGQYQPDITSYDYDAPMNECGDPTPKFMALRELIVQYLPAPYVPIPIVMPKMALSDIQMTPCATLLSDIGRRILGEMPFMSSKPLTFEALNQFAGLILYETQMPTITRDPSLLLIERLHDRAHIFVDDVSIGHQVNHLSEQITCQFLAKVFHRHFVKRESCEFSNDQCQFWKQTSNTCRKSRTYQFCDCQ